MLSHWCILFNDQNIEGIFEKKMTVILIHENLLFLTVGQKFYEPWVTSSRNVYELIIDLENL